MCRKKFLIQLFCICTINYIRSINDVKKNKIDNSGKFINLQVNAESHLRPSDPSQEDQKLPNKAKNFLKRTNFQKKPRKNGFRIVKKLMNC